MEYSPQINASNFTVNLKRFFIILYKKNYILYFSKDNLYFSKNNLYVFTPPNMLIINHIQKRQKSVFYPRF